MYILSERLKKIAEQIKGGRIADIGTDHGYLPIFLVNNCKAQKVIACDIREKPLKNAQGNIEKSGAHNIELRLCDGLEGIAENEVDTVIIAGMGGEVITRILDRCDWIKSSDYTLFVQPMTAADVLRTYLAINGFRVVNETAVLDGGKYYCIMKLCYDGITRDVKPHELYVGTLKPNDDTTTQYIKKQLAIVNKCCTSLENVPEMIGRYLYFKSISEKISDILGGN